MCGVPLPMCYMDTYVIAKGVVSHQKIGTLSKHTHCTSVHLRLLGLSR